jgi:hypothetical protein
MGYRQLTLERLARNDKFARFRTRGRPDKFWGNEATIFLNNEVVSSGVDCSHTEFKREEKSAKTAIWFKRLLISKIPTRSNHKKDWIMVTRL